MVQRKMKIHTFMPASGSGLLGSKHSINNAVSIQIWISGPADTWMIPQELYGDMFRFFFCCFITSEEEIMSEITFFRQLSPELNIQHALRNINIHLELCLYPTETLKFNIHSFLVLLLVFTNQNSFIFSCHYVQLVKNLVVWCEAAGSVQRVDGNNRLWLGISLIKREWVNQSSKVAGRKTKTAC